MLRKEKKVGKVFEFWEVFFFFLLGDCIENGVELSEFTDSFFVVGVITLVPAH